MVTQQNFMQAKRDYINSLAHPSRKSWLHTPMLAGFHTGFKFGWKEGNFDKIVDVEGMHKHPPKNFKNEMF